MNFRQLRYFCEVTDSGTLARAAERLHVAPTAISMQIAQLEEHLGGALFDRGVRPMALTALGRFFLPPARGFLEAGPWGDVLTEAAMVRGELQLVVDSALAREDKEAEFRHAIRQGASTAELLGLTETLQRLGLR